MGKTPLLELPDKAPFPPPARRYIARVKTDDPEYCRLERLEEEARLEDRKHAHKLTREEWARFSAGYPSPDAEWEVVETSTDSTDKAH